MALERYRAKRDFAKTPEPAGRAKAREGRRFEAGRSREETGALER